ncbi:unnamed protein product [Protopolystoma xenopodis]|uniref:Uncharacterized protein n=1 Tax=Protopolystoma xenopodis TaxID=117903 RepID=A0A3S5CUZ7_9PLAT|nr:unnamed protein product [Protopolystoma xenopodis]
MTILTDDADYDAGETFKNVPRPRFNVGNDHADNELRTRYVEKLGFEESLNRLMLEYLSARLKRRVEEIRKLVLPEAVEGCNRAVVGFVLIGLRRTGFAGRFAEDILAQIYNHSSEPITLQLSMEPIYKSLPLGSLNEMKVSLTFNHLM